MKVLTQVRNVSSKVLIVALLVVLYAAVPDAAFAAPDGGALLGKAQAWFGSVPVAVPLIALGIFGVTLVGKVLAEIAGNLDWVDRFDRAIKAALWANVGIFLLPVGLTFLNQLFTA